MRKTTLLTFVFLIAVISVSAQVNFKNHDYFYPIAYPSKLVNGDFNSDGVTDVAALGEYGLYFLTNTPATQAPRVTFYGPALYWRNIMPIDFDGDHDLDLAYSYNDSLHILTNSGSLTFHLSSKAYFIGDDNSSLTSADFNNDGKADIAVGRYLSKTVSIYLNSATGLTSPVQYSVGTTTAMEHADFNGDQIEDLVVVNQEEHSFSVLINNGNGTFKTPETYVTSLNPAFVLVADMDGDSKKDVVIGNTDGAASSFFVYKNNGNNFSLLSSFVTGVQLVTPDFATAGDFDDDEDIDVAYIDWDNGTLTILHNDGDANFVSPVIHNVGIQPRAVVAGDVNGDGKTDVTVGFYAGIQTAYNVGNDSFNIITSGAIGPTNITQADFNKDGSPDIAATNSNTGTLSIMLNDKQGAFLTQDIIELRKGSASICTGDVNNDNIHDLIVANPEDDSISLLIGIGDGTFAEPQNYQVGHGAIDLALEDINADGLLDILTVNSLDASLSLLLNTNAGFQSAVTISAVYQVSIISTGDLTGDNLPDLVVASYPGSLFLMKNSGNGTFASPEALYTNYRSAKAVLISDFTFDGIPDIGYSAEGYFHVLVNEGNGNFTIQSFLNGTSEANHISIGDFTGDGRQDVAVASIASLSMGVLVANEEGGYYEAVTFPYRGYLIDMVAANFDGDDKDDIAIAGWPYSSLNILTSLPLMTITLHDTTRLYGNSNPLFKSDVEGWPLTKDLSIEYKCDATKISRVGTYPVWPVVSDSVAQNFAIVKHSGILTITPAPLTVTANDTTRAFGEVNPHLTARFEGLVNDDYFPVYVYTDASPLSPGGEYPIVPYISGGDQSNYNITVVNGTLTVTESVLHPYPNPSRGDFSIFNQNSDPVKYSIMNINGQILNVDTLAPHANQMHLPLPPGIYLMKTEDGLVCKIAIE